MRTLKTSCRIILCLTMLLGCFACSSDNEEEITPPTPTPEEITFSYAQGNYAGINLPYRTANIHAMPNEKSALVIYLHGGSSKGNDNEKQMSEAGIDSISDYLSRKGINATFIVPQCPVDKSWGGTMNTVLKALIDSQVENGTVDSDRIYIFGGSMGGSGTWSLLSAYPGLFAAAMPVAGNPAGCIPANVAKTPVFTVMGTDDRIMSMDTVNDFITELKGVGGDCRYEVENGWTHEITCIESYTTDRLDWVFSH